MTGPKAEPYNLISRGDSVWKDTMRIEVNGEWKEYDDGLTVADLLATLSLEPLRCAVELNRQLVPRTRHAETRLAEQDTLEIVTLVGGG